MSINDKSQLCKGTSAGFRAGQTGHVPRGLHKKRASTKADLFFIKKKIGPIEAV